MLFSRAKSLTPSDAAAAPARGELQLIDVRKPAELGEARVKGGVIAWERAGLPLGARRQRDAR
jgi:rhodanese-related sulfurtransferase